MKFIIPLILASALSFPAFAQKSKSELHAKCASVANVSEKIMMARQLGVPYSEVIELARKTGSELGLEITRIAYQSPVMPTNEQKARVIFDFRNTLETYCYENSRSVL